MTYDKMWYSYVQCDLSYLHNVHRTSFFKTIFSLYFLEIVFDAIMCNYDFQRWFMLIGFFLVCKNKHYAHGYISIIGGYVYLLDKVSFFLTAL